MRLSQFCVLSAVGILCLPSSVFAAPATLQPKTAAAVIAADEGWLKAEETGDTAYIDNLLLPEYRSVNADGSVHDKAAILASTRKNAGSTARSVADQKWLAAHPMGTAVLIQGDTAIVTFYLKPLGPEKGIMSSDIFVYRDGQWHAIYSQHTDAGK
jgi:hypothetical protein